MHGIRDAQFRYVNEQAKAHQHSADPVISVDTRKKENVGEFKNGGWEWRPEAEPAGVRTHDFPDEQLGKAIPYGVYDLTANAGWVPPAPTTTPPRSPSNRSAAGGTRRAGLPTQGPGGC